MTTNNFKENTLKFNKTLVIPGKVGKEIDVQISFIFEGEPAFVQFIPTCSCTILENNQPLVNGVNIYKLKFKPLMVPAEYNRSVTFSVVQDGQVVFSDKLTFILNVTHT